MTEENNGNIFLHSFVHDHGDLWHSRLSRLSLLVLSVVLAFQFQLQLILCPYSFTEDKEGSLFGRKLLLWNSLKGGHRGKQCANMDLTVPSVWAYLTQRKKKNNLWTPSIHSCQTPSSTWESRVTDNICFFCCQPASFSQCPSLSFSVPAWWFNQGKQLGTGRLGWFTGSPDLFYILPANGARLAALHGNKKTGGRQTGWQSIES